MKSAVDMKRETAMKEKRSKSETLCHRCKHGGAVVECCRCPDLSPDVWSFADKTDEHMAHLQAASFVASQKIAENRLPTDFSFIPYVAVSAAVCRGSCKYYAENAQK